MTIRQPLFTSLLLAFLFGLASAQEADKKPAPGNSSEDTRLLWKFDTGG